MKTDRKMVKKNQKWGEVDVLGVKWSPISGVNYKHDYIALLEEARKIDDYRREHGGEEHSKVESVIRSLCLEDLWFFVYFVMRVSVSNNKFWVEACREVEEKRDLDRCLWIWAREHGKTSIITVGDSIVRVLKNAEERTVFFSSTREIARSFLRQVKMIFEESLILKKCFPDICYENPAQEAFKWSEIDGLFLKRRGLYKEATFEAWGLIEGMPTSKHYTRRVYDDLVTEDVVKSPEQSERLESMFFLSHNLGTEDGSHAIVGTPYRHNDLLNKLRVMKDSTGKSVYNLSLKPATDDGTPTGKPVLLSKERLEFLRQNRQMFYCQQLLDPTPIGTQKLRFQDFQWIVKDLIPQNLYRFMLIDPAGSKGGGDNWAMGVVGVAPYLDDLGASSIYILDLYSKPVRLTEAMKQVLKMYTSNGTIERLGVEKVGISSAEIHIENMLSVHGYRVSQDNGRLILLSPRGRNKEQRIESALLWPLENKKVFIVQGVNQEAVDRLEEEMDRFPYWHDDTIDMISYIYDVIKEYRFFKYSPEAPREETFWERVERIEGVKQPIAAKRAWLGA